MPDTLPRWRFVLANSKDLSPIGHLTQARSRQLTVALNSSGNCQFVIPMDDDLGQQIQPISSAIRTLRVGSTGVIEPWSGYVNTIEEDVSAGMMTVNAVGWQERLGTRLLRRDKIYTAMDDGDIILDLLAEANLTTAPDGSGYVIPVVSGSSPATPTWIQAGSKLPNEGTGGLSIYTNATRNFNLQRYTTILQAIQTLIGTENGADVWIDPSTRALNIYRKRRRILTTVVFGFQWGPENIQQFNRQIDGSTVVNYQLVTGGSATTPQGVDDPASLASYGLIEATTSLSDLIGANANSIMAAYAMGEIAVRKQPRQIFSITPFQWYSGGAVPEPFVDYNIGDQVRFVARRKPRINIDQQVRIFGMQIGIDDEGNENLGQLQVSP